MGQLIFVVGGAGSGKSKFAVGLAKKLKGPVAFVATGSPSDKEMQRKIKNHKKERPGHWRTIEAAQTPFGLNGQLKNVSSLLIDSLTLWVSSLTLKEVRRNEIKKKCALFFKEIQKKLEHIVVVSDEVGLGVVPETESGRNFREVLGVVNQAVADAADAVFLVSVGLPIRIK